MAHRIYQGKTGVVWNITQRAVGVLLKKQVGPRFRTKRLHVRIEHVRPSGRRMKRAPKGPDPECVVDVSKSELVALRIQP